MAVPTRLKNTTSKATLLVHHLEQVIEDEYQRHIARAIEDLSREAQPIEQFVRHDIVRSSSGVSIHDQPTANENLGEYARQYGDEIKHTRNPGLETRRRFCESGLSLELCSYSFLLTRGIAIKGDVAQIGP